MTLMGHPFFPMGHRSQIIIFFRMPIFSLINRVAMRPYIKRPEFTAVVGLYKANHRDWRKEKEYA